MKNKSWFRIEVRLIEIKDNPNCKDCDADCCPDKCIENIWETNNETYINKKAFRTFAKIKRLNNRLNKI